MYCHDKYQWVLPPIFIEMRNVCSGRCRAASLHQIQVIMYAECESASLYIKQFKRSFRVTR